MVNTLGRYRIIRELARSNDIVYEAVDPAQGKKIALKELQMPQHLAGQARQERIERFLREARSAERLKHPNIVRIFQFGQEQGRYYIAMEFLEGQSLRDVIRQRGALPLSEALRIAAAVADGLEFAHRNKVIHRDIKPDNVHLEPDGRVVITDFGIARIQDEASLTAHGQIFGTPSYMSPEQVAGRGVDRRSDLFSLGVMLYEMVAGRKPFSGDSVITITYNIMNMEMPPLAGVPAGVEQIIRRAMAKDPARRYQTAVEMAEDLRSVAQGGAPKHAASMPPPPAASSASPAVHSAPIPPPASPRSANAPGTRPTAWGGPASGAGALPPSGGAGAPAWPAASGPRPPANPSVARGARPLPPAPWGAASSPNPARSSNAPGPNWGAAGPPTGVNMPAPAQGGLPRARSASRGGTDIGWLLGWLGVTIAIALVIVLGLWGVLRIQDQMRLNQQQTVASRSYQEAERAAKSGQLEQAWSLYQQALSVASPQDRRVLLFSWAEVGVDLARAKLQRNELSQAEAICREVLMKRPKHVSAYLALGTVLSDKGDVTGALKAFDETMAKAREVTRVPEFPADREKAQQIARLVPQYRAQVLYDDGVALRFTDPAQARRRFEAVIRTAPGTDFARAADQQLQQLGIREATPASGSSSTVPGDPAGSVPPPQAPPGWDASYRQALPGMPSGGLGVIPGFSGGGGP